METHYPKQHKEVVSELLAGKFILYSNVLFNSITTLPDKKYF